RALRRYVARPRGLEAVGRRGHAAGRGLVLAVSHGPAGRKHVTGIWLDTLDTHTLAAAALACLALALLLAGVAPLLRALRQGRSQETVERALAARDPARTDAAPGGDAPAHGPLLSALSAATALGAQWSAGKLGRTL